MSQFLKLVLPLIVSGEMTSNVLEYVLQLLTGPPTHGCCSH